MQEKIKTSNKIPIEQVKKIIYVSIEYIQITHFGPNVTKAQNYRILCKIVIPIVKQHKQQV